MTSCTAKSRGLAAAISSAASREEAAVTVGHLGIRAGSAAIIVMATATVILTCAIGSVGGAALLLALPPGHLRGRRTVADPVHLPCCSGSPRHSTAGSDP